MIMSLYLFQTDKPVPMAMASVDVVEPDFTSGISFSNEVVIDDGGNNSNAGFEGIGCCI